uniref:rho GTPase-activating protein SYDE2 n=1 Tax=Euleptes europaea TaxID=460621 RepID=UPI00253F9D46|nr:rho GTPase-activating protein SYDE2 [Euleptes europaea]
MADPLRRTLSKLRSRRSQRGAAGAGEAAGGKAHKSLRPPGDGAPRALLGGRAGCYRALVAPSEEPRPSEPGGGPRPGEGAPGAAVACPCPAASRREGTAPPPPGPPGLHAPPTTEPCFPAADPPGGADPGSPPERGGGGEEEEEDYYDNQSLPGWGCQGASGAQEEARGKKDGGGGGHGARARESPGRLRSQLQEAYDLLIHAMHDLPPPASPRSPPPAAGAVESGGAAPPRGDGCPGLLRADAPACPQTSSAAAWRRGLSKSLDSLPPARPLPRSRSDGALRSLPREPTAPRGHPRPEPGAWRGAAAARRPCEGGPDGRSAARGEPSAARLLLPGLRPGPSGSPAVDGRGASKPPAVTVRKLQQWMHKGRLLSLGAKGRGAAAAPPSPPSKASGLLLGREEGPAAPSPTRGRAPGSTAPGPPSDQRIWLADLIENVYIPSVSRRDFKNFKSSEMAECTPRIASITVSKKRNWLHQSSPRAPNLEKGDSYKKISGETHQVLKSPSLLLEPKMPQTFPKPLGYENPNRRNGSAHAAVNGERPLALRNCTLEFGEDNDADDEGEIWYNPIPEDDEPDFPCFVHNNADRSDSQAMNCKISSANDMINVAVHNEGVPQSFNCTGDTQPREISQVDCVHSMEHLQVQKPKPACTILSGFVTEDSSTLKGSSGGPGILSASKTEMGAADCSPSSPNSSKKGGSINWTFPDKIKSPRTVRKLSIKMKKLPELSRKLSVKGNPSHNSSDNTSLLKNNCQDIGHASLPSSGNVTAAASRNVISRYHLDSSVSSQHNYKKKSNGSSKSSSKGGYLSDGDSPELITKSGKHAAESRAGKGKEAFPNNNGSKAEIDIDAFRHYSFSDQPKCSQYISGLMSIHFYGAEDLKPPRMDSKDVFCAIQVDSVNKARTALLTCRTTFLDMDHTFNIEIENAQHLKLVVFSWEPMPRKNRVCCHGTVVLPALFRVTKTHQLAVKLEPRGLIYVKLTLLEQWENSLNGLDGEREPVIFGVDVRKVVEKENVGLMVPLLMKKCIMEIEKRGCQVVGLYRLCGSAAVKKELREAFEKDSKAVTLCETQYPDINVITGVLKDYLRELPSPLITKQLYEAVLDAMVKSPLKMTANGCDNNPSDSEHTVSLLDCLPDIEKATLRMLLDHLKLVASYHEVNRMTCQNLAVCFGPVLLSQRQETANHNNRVFTDSEELASALDFKKHIEVLHYLLQLWPVQRSAAKESALPEQQALVNYLRPKKQRPQMLNLNSTEITGILRSRPARLDSPSSNRYAGDWSGCGESYFVNPKEAFSEADYDDVPSEDAESGDDSSRADGSDKLIEQPNCVSKEHTFQAYLAMQTMDSSVNHRVNLKDLQESIDTLIGNLERELNKNKLNIRY